MVRFLIIVFILLDMKEHIYAILGIQVVTSVIFDSYFLILDFSLQLGVNGIAYSNAIAFITLIYAVIVFSRKMEMGTSDWSEGMITLG